MRVLSLRAPAKLNLFLRVLRKRDDGYHDIETLFERITLWDEVTLSDADGSENGIHLDVSSNGELPGGPKNLVYQAAELFKSRFNIRRGIRIRLVKKIPIAAGLGGGSSDAASVLLGLNQFWGAGASLEELFHLGRRIGADITFFLLEKRRALGKGRGEILEPQGDSPRSAYLLATPRVSVLTKDVYAGWDSLAGLTQRPKDGKIHFPNNLPDPDQWINDLEPVVVQKYKAVREFARALRGMGLADIRLSGSGPTYFIQTENLRQADTWAEKIKSSIRDCQVYCVEGY